MALYLVQHGKSLSKAQDPRKGLSEEGLREVQMIAQVAAQYQIKVRRIDHSGKQRALQTAEILGAALQPAEGVQAVGGMNPLDDVVRFASTLQMSQNRMLVGHLPFLEKLTAFLITGKEDPPVLKLQNGGIVCLNHYPESTNVVVKWALMPDVS